MNADEYRAKAMLLGMEWAGTHLMVGDKFTPLLRQRVGPGRFAGCALFSYFNADTLEPIPHMQDRSELDQPI